MSPENLLNLDLNHWQAFLLSIIPALITLSLVVHVYTKLPFYRMNRIYLLFLFCLFIYQVNDSMLRLSSTEETARSWDRLLVIIWVMIAPTGFHWALFLTGKKRLANDLRLIIPLYFSAVFFAIPLVAGLYSQPLNYSAFWGWGRTYKNNTPFLSVTLLWWCLIFTSMLYLFAAFAYKSRHSPELKFVSLMNFIGYSIPLVGGIFTQLILPVFFNINPIPLGSTLMVTTCLVVIGLNSYKVFNLSETIDTEYISEIIQEIIFVVTPGRSVKYMNVYGTKFFMINKSEHPGITNIFRSKNVLDAFEEQVLVPSFNSNTPRNYQFFVIDKDGKEIHWDVSTYQIYNRSVLDGLIVMCRDVSDRVLLAEARLSALRTQMNPHFIFNSLNSIQYYIHNYDREAAETYLSAFSILTRKILDNSSKFSIPLSDEMRTLELYLQLEKTRFGDRLHYEICVDSNIDQDNLLVPSMLIQPYIENAIIHGLSPLDKGGKVRISITDASEALLCFVTDNGVGRKKSMELKAKNGVNRQSYGMSITDARLGILNQKLNVPVSVKITDLVNELNEPAGTQVEIFIPVNERF